MKLTEEEMHELEILTLLREKDFDHNTCDNSYIDLVMKSGKKAFEIINKQQKEIEELTYNNEILKKLPNSKEKYIAVLESKLFNSVSKDKIKEKIKNLSKEEKKQLKGTKGQDRYSIKQEFMYKRSVLEELLGE